MGLNMLNEEKVKLMTKLAIYESEDGKAELKIGEYRKKDYISSRRIITLILITLGYLLLLSLYAYFQAERLIDGLYTMNFFWLGIMLLSGYILIIIFYIMISNKLYTKQYKKARKNIKPYYLNLKKLNKIYQKEQQKTNSSTLRGEAYDGYIDKTTGH